MFRLISLIAVLAVFSATPAAAFGLKLPVKIPGGLGPEGAEKTLREIQGDVKDANSALNYINYGKDADRELSSIQKAENLIKQAKSKTGITLRMASGYQATLKDIENTEKRIANAKLAHECTKALLEIYRKQKSPEGAKDADFKKLEDAVKKFESAKPEGFDKIVTFFTERIQYVKEKNDELHARAKAKAEKEAAEAARQKASAAIKRVNDAAAAVRSAFEREIDSDLIAAYEEAIKDETLTPAHKAFYEHELFHMKREEAFKGGDGKKAGKVIAKMVGGKAVAAGENKSKNIKLSFNTKKDNCYFVFSRFDKPKNTKLEKWEWSQRGKGALPQVFVVRPGRNSVGSTVHGVCATHKAKMTATAEAEYPGSRNPYNYTVIEIPRNKVPVTLTAHLDIVVEDQCDLDWWASLWKNPIPGTIAYRKHEPVLIAGSGGAGDGSISYFNVVSTKWNGSNAGNASHDVPNLVEFASKYGYWKCNVNFAKSSNGLRIKKCEEKIWKKYKKRYNRLQEKVDAARDAKLINLTAEAALSELDAKIDKEMEKKCQPLREKVNAEAEKVVNNLIDTMTDTPPKEKQDRLEYLRMERAAFRN